MSNLGSYLGFMGALLFLLGLLNGFAIPLLKSPRIGLSAHLTAIESGIALMTLALLMRHLAISPGWAVAIAYTASISLYLLWIGLLSGGAFGTGRIFPIAGGGMPAAPWQEHLTRALISTGSLGSAAAFIALLVLWRWTI